MYLDSLIGYNREEILYRAALGAMLLVIGRAYNINPGSDSLIFICAVAAPLLSFN
ncbi:MAG: hypothetical protein JWN14_3259 [Chthonomonadales bacterium]|nr:hypothetical protein [Chthonomonadales bacterium]